MQVIREGEEWAKELSEQREEPLAVRRQQHMKGKSKVK